eukprot:CAMPEP_0181455266 /NCGR_PEP_ID=MMETSP1110-20121109/30669_1 /TAXON_ID=174948 /ORGANISM="Symbiodinium sp., Strain CCMP421" /LENGTH=65 /DNA_ID=CAMNT_0023579645 /DNA_START=452 /DNA_END=652 /DNA_ORIENTATION=-
MALVPVQTCPSPASIEDARGREADVGDTNSKPVNSCQNFRRRNNLLNLVGASSVKVSQVVVKPAS